jgi:hypothetical protein
METPAGTLGSPSGGGDRAASHGASGAFAPTGSLNTARDSHTATLLGNGTVLIAGGGGRDGMLASAEIYHPAGRGASGRFHSTGHLGQSRQGAGAILLGNGRVLIAGGDGSSGALASAELYDPATGRFTATGSLLAARDAFTATRLRHGEVLMVGGDGPFNGGGFRASAELYERAEGRFSATARLATARARHTATLLHTGAVLIAGGHNDSGLLASAELYRR